MFSQRADEFFLSDFNIGYLKVKAKHSLKTPTCEAASCAPCVPSSTMYFRAASRTPKIVSEDKVTSMSSVKQTTQLHVVV